MLITKMLIRYTQDFRPPDEEHWTHLACSATPIFIESSVLKVLVLQDFAGCCKSGCFTSFMLFGAVQYSLNQVLSRTRKLSKARKFVLVNTACMITLKNKHCKVHITVWKKNGATNHATRISTFVVQPRFNMREHRYEVFQEEMGWLRRSQERSSGSADITSLDVYLWDVRSTRFARNRYTQ